MLSLTDFDDAKNGLLRYYASKETAHSARLIGFTVALFTLLQTVSRGPLSEFFSVWAGYVLYESWLSHTLAYVWETVPTWAWGAGRFFLLFFSIVFLITLTIHTIFRYLVYAKFSQYVVFVGQSEISKYPLPIHHSIHKATFEMVKKQKLLGLLRAELFIPTRRDDKTWRGWIWCSLLAIFFGALLLLLLW